MSSARPWLPMGTLIALAAAPAGCDVGQGPATGIGEPIQVLRGQFVPGDLPGTPPPPEDAGIAARDASTAPLSVLGISLNSAQVVPGISGKSISGDVSDDAVAVGVKLMGLGTGYWVVPVGGPDLLLSHAYGFGISASFDPNDPPGLRNLAFVAFGPSGSAGTQNTVGLCIDSRIPDNGHACDPSIAPPAAVFSLQWDTNFDLDLHVVSASGVDFNPKMPLGEPLDAAAVKIPKNAPRVDRDSLRGCQPDGLRQEDLIFPVSLPKGSYRVYVDPFDACGKNDVRFTFTVYQSNGKCPACELRPQPLPRGGELLASQVTGGTAPPLFVQQIDVN